MESNQNNKSSYSYLKDLERETINGNFQDYNKYLDNIKEYSSKVKGKKGNTSQGITTSQIRIIFSEVKKISKLEEKESIEQVQKLRVKLAYTGGRGSQDLKNFTTSLENIISRIKNKSGVQRLYDFIEAVVCYLKYHGDRD